MGNKKFTFKQLLTAQKVEIPVLQRDYVQGNLKDKKAENIREDFVADLVNHLVLTQPDEMTLDFIYGKIIDDDLSEEQERHEEHLESLLETVSEYAKKSGYEIHSNFKRLNEFVSKDTFIPFDGQQRLTTLFLLHFLVYTKLDKDISLLRQFLYKTRESSRDFLEALLNNASDFATNEVWEHSFLTFIQDRNWFYDFWKYDPTVMSMMVMLEAFREKITQQEDLQKSFVTIHSNLESENVLTFDFLDIDEHQLDDILYVKMNASGKELTDFEKFKSWLIEYVEDKKNNIIVDEQDWETKLDTVWYDLFWEVGKNKTDELLYQFIKKMLVLKYCSKEIVGIDEEEKQKNQKTRKLIYDKLNGKDPISFKFYIEHNIIDADSLNFIFFNLDKLTENSGDELFETCIRKVWNKTFIANWNNDQLFKHFLVRNIASFNLFHQTFLFAVFNYVEQLNINSEEFKEEKFLDWIRLSRNLIYNSRIDDATPFFSALQSLQNFGSYCLDSKSALTNEKFIDYFPERQRKEEHRKNKEIYSEWKDDFITAENHNYFYGQIGFLIRLSKIENEPNLERFRYLYEQISKIFSEENLNGKNLISRSLLTINDNWMPDYGSNRYLLCLSDRANSRERDENWRRVFNDPTNRKIFIELADLYKTYGTLEDVITCRKEDVNDWRRLFLDYPDELKYCKQGLINYQNNGNYIRLLGQSRISHYHRELRTSILFNNFLKPKFNLDDNNYKEPRSNDSCYIEITLVDRTFQIHFSNKNLCFKIIEVVYKNDETLKKQISNLDFSKIDKDLAAIIDNFQLYLDIEEL